MKGRLTPAILLNIALLSMVATCDDLSLGDGLMDMEPGMIVPGITPFTEGELEDRMRDMREVLAPANNQSIASLDTFYVPVPENAWSSVFGGLLGDAGNFVQQTTDGGYVIAGYTSSYGSGSDDVWLIKTDSSGNEMWNKTFGGSNGDCAYSVQETNDGGYVIAGITMSYGAGLSDFWLIKTDSSGNEMWNNTFGGNESDNGFSVQQTSDGGYIMAGDTWSYDAGLGDVWLIKTNSTGNEMWNRTFGGTSYDTGRSVQQTSDGGYVIAGSNHYFGSFSATDVWLIKTDSTGNEVWNKTFGGTSYDTGWSVQQTTDGGYIITGSTKSFGAGDYDVFLIKTDSTGNETWNKTFGGANHDYGNSVQQTSEGGYAIVGDTESYGSGWTDIWLVKTDSSGNKVWDKVFGGSDYDLGHSLQETTDNGLIVVGSTQSYGPGIYSVWLIKTEPLHTLYYPDFTDTTDPKSWRSWLVIQNPTASTANIEIELRSRTGTLLYSGNNTIPANSVSAIRPRELVKSDCSGSVIVASDQPIMGTCQIILNNNEMCMSYSAPSSPESLLYYPDFTDTNDTSNWRSWFVIQNPTSSAANIDVVLRSRTGVLLCDGNSILLAGSVSAIRPMNLVGYDCAGSAVVISDRPIVGTCQIIGNNNEMCMSYAAIHLTGKTLYYPDFTDTIDTNSWRSWFVIQNPSDETANIDIVLRSRTGGLLYSGSSTIPPRSVGAIRPRNLAGYDCAGSAIITSSQPIVGTCQITRNSNEMCMSYQAIVR